MDLNLKNSIEYAFAHAVGLPGVAIERDGCWWVEVERQDCGPGFDWHRTWEVEPREGVDFEFHEV